MSVSASSIRESTNFSSSADAQRPLRKYFCEQKFVAWIWTHNLMNTKQGINHFTMEMFMLLLLTQVMLNC